MTDVVDRYPCFVEFVPDSHFLPPIESSHTNALEEVGMQKRLLRIIHNESHSRKGIPSAHMHWASISDLATLGMWADPGSYAWYVGGPR